VGEVGERLMVVGAHYFYAMGEILKAGGTVIGGIAFVIALTLLVITLGSIIGGLVGGLIAVLYNTILGTSFSLTTAALAGSIICVLAGSGAAAN